MTADGAGGTGDGVHGQPHDAARGRCRATTAGGSRGCGARPAGRRRLAPSAAATRFDGVCTRRAGRAARRTSRRPARPRADARCGGCHQESPPRSSLTAARRRAEEALGLSDTSPSEGVTPPRASGSASGSWPHRQTGQLGRADAAAREIGEEALDAAVLVRVEADRGEPAAGHEQLPGLGQRRVERVELAVDGDPQGLEGALGRVAAAEALGRGQRRP